MRAEFSVVDRRHLAFALIVVAAIAWAFGSGNLHAPVQRDGSHFLFMAVNIAAGQPPYWASFETKNPFVEYLWAFGLMAFKGNSSVATARVVEHAYLSLTAFAIFVFIARAFLEPRLAHAHPYTSSLPNLTGIVAAALYLCATLDHRVTDDGFNIALYQSLPELATVWALLQVARTLSPVAAGLAGLGCFLAWFTKQTSLIALAFPMAAAILVAFPKQGFCRCAIAFIVPIVVCVTVWFGYLAATDTLGNYVLGTMSYRTEISALLWPEFGRNLGNLFRIANPGDLDSLAYQFHKVLAWFLPVLLAASAILAALRVLRGDRDGALVIGVAALWLLGTFAQAVVGLTFFRHYFLACIAPAALVAAVMLRDAPRIAVLALFVVPVAALTSVWAWKYASWAPAIAERARQAPMTHTVHGLRPLLPSGARVYNWNGLPHFHAYTGRPSDYPLNLWWPWIMTTLPEDQRDARLRAIFRESAPEYFLEIVESYPPNQGLKGFPLSLDLLAHWTGNRYELAGTVTPPAGRYGVPARVFRRVD